MYSTRWQEPETSYPSFLLDRNKGQIVGEAVWVLWTPQGGWLAFLLMHLCAFWKGVEGSTRTEHRVPAQGIQSTCKRHTVVLCVAGMQDSKGDQTSNPHLNLIPPRL